MSKSPGNTAFGLGKSASILAVLTLVSALTSAQAGSVFIGDGAVFGAAQPAGTGSRADILSPLSYIFSSEVAGVSFAASSATEITLMSVNLLAQNAGSLTPFVASFNGGSAADAANYTLLAEGDTLAIPAGNSSGVLFNGQFTVGGVNPTLNLQANETIVAGLFQSSQIVVFSGTAQSDVNDRIWRADVTSGVSPGQTLGGGNAGFNFNATYFYDVGFQQVQLPEPDTWAMLGIGAAGLLGYGYRRRTRGQPAKRC